MSMQLKDSEIGDHESTKDTKNPTVRKISEIKAKKKKTEITNAIKTSKTRSSETK